MPAVPLNRVMEAGASGTSTASDIAITIDPASTVPAPSGRVFISQREVDDYLAAASGSSFKYIQDVFDALPSIIAHQVTISLAAGVHRPKPGASLLETIKAVLATGELIITGLPVAQYDTVHSGGTIRSHQVLDEITGTEDPYVECDAATFPDDGSLRGRFAVFSNGFYSQIWDHDDKRLWLCTTLNPVPIDDSTTVAVKQPASILRQSIDDLVRCGTGNWMLLFEIGSAESDAHVNAYLRDLLIQDFSSEFALAFRSESRWDIERVILDKKYGPVAEAGGAFYVWNGYADLNHCSILATPAVAATGYGLYVGGGCHFFRGYIEGFHSGGFVVSQYGAYGRAYASVFRGCGGSWPSLWAWGNDAYMNFGAYYGVIPTIVEAPAAGGIAYGGLFQDMYGRGLRFVDCVGPCVVLWEDCLLTLQWGGIFEDGGGNQDVGFLLVGPNAVLTLNTGDDVTGSNGDVKFASDGSIWSYEQITAFGPIEDDRRNYVER